MVWGLAERPEPRYVLGGLWSCTVRHGGLDVRVVAMFRWVENAGVCLTALVRVSNARSDAWRSIVGFWAAQSRMTLRLKSVGLSMTVKCSKESLESKK